MVGKEATRVFGSFEGLARVFWLVAKLFGWFSRLFWVVAKGHLRVLHGCNAVARLFGWL